MNMSAPDRNHNHNDALAALGVASHEEALELWLGHCVHLGEHINPKEFLVLSQLLNKPGVGDVVDDMMASDAMMDEKENVASKN